MVSLNTPHMHVPSLMPTNSPRDSVPLLFMAILTFTSSGGLKDAVCTPVMHTPYIPLSFDWARHHSWFSSFAAKWVLGVKAIHGAGPFLDVSDRLCPLCDTRHPLDIVSSVAFCDDIKPFVHQLADSWGPNISPVVHQWLTGPRSRGELRNFARP